MIQESLKAIKYIITHTIYMYYGIDTYFMALRCISTALIILLRTELFFCKLISCDI